MSIKLANNYGGMAAYQEMMLRAQSGVNPDTVKMTVAMTKSQLQLGLIQSGNKDDSGGLMFDTPQITNSNVLKTMQMLEGNNATGQNSKVEQIRQMTKNSMKEFSAYFTDLLGENGVNTSQTFSLYVADDGAVVVDGDHPDKEKIEKLFKDNTTLHDSFAKISMLSEFVKQTDVQAEYSQMFAKNGKLADLKYGEFVREEVFYRFDMVVKEDSITSSFTKAEKQG